MKWAEGGAIAHRLSPTIERGRLRLKFFLWRRGMQIVEYRVRSPWALTTEQAKNRREKNRRQRKARRLNRLRRKQ